ncbi:MAG: sugar phosphate isomerase/epimerase [Defluviitaleaceae bacterium]|nr:sugar phosphate isomerase/epimerase [Defluviitaleaceae bacterium]
MNKPVVALQLYTVRDFAAKNLCGTLSQVKAMGYDAVELAGTYGMETAAFKKLLDEKGLEAISAHVGYDAFEADAEGTIAMYKALGCKVVSIPWMDLNLLPGGADFEKTKALIAKAAPLCKASGMILGYHNHDFELQEKTPCGAFVLDALFSETKADELQAQLDTGWVTAAGQDPVAYIKKYAGRCPTVHLKDITPANTDKTVELLNSESKLESGAKYEDRPVGQGIQDMPAVTKAAVEAGALIMVVELDEAVGITSLEAAKQSREYLKALGY